MHCWFYMYYGVGLWNLKKLKEFYYKQSITWWFLRKRIIYNRKRRETYIVAVHVEVKYVLLECVCYRL